MQSYLSNRHYHCLTQMLPKCLRTDQPQRIYYRTFMDNDALALYDQCKKTTYRNIGEDSFASPEKGTSEVQQRRNGKVPKNSQEARGRNYKNGKHSYNSCPLCGETHIAVQYHGHRHICVKCRNFVRDQHGNQIKVFLDENGEIVCLGILPKSFEREKVGYYITDHTKLEVKNRGVYASYGGETQLVLILKDEKIA